jgi:hypothetical protein
MDIHLWEGKKSNVLLVGPHGAGVFKDVREADPQRRFKMFYRGYVGISARALMMTWRRRLVASFGAG